DPATLDLQAQLAGVREKIDQHELTRLKAKEAELAETLAVAEIRRQRERGRLERRLQEAEPTELREVRLMIEKLFAQHRNGDVPQIITGYTATIDEHNSFVARGEALCSCSARLRDLWKIEDWQ